MAAGHSLLEDRHAAVKMAPPSAVEGVLGHRFRNRALGAALLPPSTTRPDPAAFQRLEFLGDRVLGLLLAERLFARYPDAQEGALSMRLSYLASGEVLTVVAGESGLTAAVERDLAPDPFPAGRRVLGDCVEAALGALWSDGGSAAAGRFVDRFMTARIEALTIPPQDAKTALQEWTQARGLELPAYSLLRRSGEDHGPVFEMEVRVDVGAGRSVNARAQGHTKRAAEKDAAAILVERLSEVR